MVFISESVSTLFQHHKTNLNFLSKSDDEFLSFLLSTVSNIVDSVKPVFGDKKLSVDSVASTSLPGSLKKRRNVDRFPCEQVNKLLDTSTVTEEVNKENKHSNSQTQTNGSSIDDHTSSKPKKNNTLVTEAASQNSLSTPVALKTTFEATQNRTPGKSQILTPCSGVRKFFSDIEDETDHIKNIAIRVTDSVSADISKVLPEFVESLPKLNAEAKSGKADTQISSTGECQCKEEVCAEEREETNSDTDSKRRVTDCKDKRCMFCPSYDPVYASAVQELLEDTLEDLEELEAYTSASELSRDDSPELMIQERKEQETALLSDIGPVEPMLPRLHEYRGSTYSIEEEPEDQTICSWHDWSMLTASNETIISPPSPTIIVPDSIRNLSDKDLRAKLIAMGAHVGAITIATRTVYEQYVVKLETTPLSGLDDSLEGYPRELVSCLQGQPQVDWSKAEQEMVEEFKNPLISRNYRQGTRKCFFNYLLIDPRIADDLPKLAATLNPREIFKRFIKSVFYVGKGKQSRPYAHLFEACLQNKDNEKLRRIRAIWTGGRGVVSLHVYNNSIAEEAFTREAVMLACIGMKKLANEKGGEYYGVSKSWTAAKRRGVGLSLLYKAHLTLLNEGHREIRQGDV